MNTQRSDTNGPGPAADALALMAQSLRHPHDPARLQQAAAGISLVDTMPLLIQLAAGSEAATAQARAVFSDANADTLRTAALRCLQHLYLSSGHDPYRVLGLNPWAEEQEVRDRYRQLIRLFHPDRGSLHEPVDPALAATLNLAYAHALQQRAPATAAGTATRESARQSASASASASTADHARDSVHGSARSAARNPAGSRRPSAETTRKPAAAARQPSRSSGLAERLHALGLFPLSRGGVWTAVILLCGLVIGSAWLSREVADTPVLAASTPTRVSPYPAAEQVFTELLPRAAMPTPDTAPQRVPPAAAPAIAKSSTTASTTASTATPIAASTSATPPQPATAVTRPAGPRTAAATLAVTVSAAPASPTAAPPTAAPPSPPPPITQPAPVEPTRAAAAATAPPTAQATPSRASADTPKPVDADKPFVASADQIEHFLANFLGSYIEGDLEQLLSLMQENLNYDQPGGKAAARRTYQRLFQASSSRDLILRDVIWNRNGSRMVASPRYEERVTLQATGETQVQRGVMHIELIDHGGKIRIAALLHKTLQASP